MKRRLFNQIGLCSIAAGVVGGSALTGRISAAKANSLASAPDQPPLDITVYRDPTCGCCHQWIEYLETQGLQVTDQLHEDMATLKQQYGIPADLTSCHTAKVEGYVIEGHVPADDIRRLVAERPEVVGIAVPGMPVGSPGMESGNRRDAFSVVSFNQAGQTAIFNHYT
ncbi:DUF411 domain-containing protein [Pseudanabaena sp. FACHB-2040]|uniref:DUF411 domain-containing protein n=1 Tax=Pseudanabaena sp. FACHB-2040 TaxID=2692859 RepID=UPI001688A180|nr:DUF411 domain-containing protein [Pseudanabaena sp. FACHB-2040]MBD2256306.1 DUF411 domain-containing protein [Pseudanabaena sp. FACHB-2040]